MPKANLIAALLLCAFVIDRLVATIFFIGSYRKAEERGANNQKLMRFVFSALFAAVAVYALNFLRVLGTFWPKGTPDPLLDAAVTWLVIVAGTERLSSFIGDRAAVAAKPPEPVMAPSEQKLRVAGTLQLDDKSENVLRLQHS
jgi:hypothetical protein